MHVEACRSDPWERPCKAGAFTLGDYPAAPLVVRCIYCWRPMEGA